MTWSVIKKMINRNKQMEVSNEFVHNGKKWIMETRLFIYQLFLCIYRAYIAK